MLVPGRQNLSDVQIAYVDGLILGLFTLIDTARQDLDIRIRIWREEERERVSLAARPVPDPVYRRLELAVGLPLEILADVADEGSRLWRRVDPDAVLVEDLEGRDRVLLQDKCKP